jgi:Ca2+:H+ antiporter
LVWVFQAANRHYYRYSAGGINVVLLNLFPLVIITLILAYLPYVVKSLVIPPTFILLLCLCSVIPLSYYIGVALGR